MIKQKEKLCKCGCGKSGFIWSKGMLKECYFKLNKPKYIKKYSEKGLEKKKIKTEITKRLHEWFLELWDKRADKDGVVKCFETGVFMYPEVFKYNTCCYSHYFPKSKYKEFAMEDWNTEIVLPDIHAQYESNPEKCPKMYEKYKKLKEKYL